MTVNSTRLGSVASSALAASGPSRTTPSTPTNRASSNGRVVRLGVWSRTRARKNSFHAVMKANNVVTTTPGARSGAITVRRTVMRDAPSTIAASSSSRGTPRT
jgi:hypothetical protein